MSDLTDRILELLPNAKLAKEDPDGDRNVIVWGPPGTGKTTSLQIILKAHLVAEHPSARIMVATFTRNARKELHTRLARDFGLMEADLPWVRTIHSAAFRLLDIGPEDVMGPVALRKFGVESGYPFEGILQQKNVDDPYGTASIQTFGDWCYVAEELRRAKLLTHAEAVRQMRPPDVAAGWNEIEARKFSETYREFKRDIHLTDFTDMLEKVLDNELTPPISFMFVDEAQDLTPLQWAVVDLWSKEVQRVFIFGDDDQAIYSFAGADPAALWRRPGHQFVLSHSYRLLANIHAEAKTIIGRAGQRVTKDFEPHAAGGEVRREWNWLDVPFEREGTTMLLARNRAFLDEARGALAYRAIPFTDRTSNLGVPGPHTAMGLCLRALCDLHAGRLIVKKQLIRNLKRGVRPGLWPDDWIKPQPVYELADLLELGATNELIRLILQNPIAALECSDAQRAYLNNLWTARGEAGVTEVPSLELSTIHGVKGEEADHVVVSTAMTRRTHMEYQSDPDPEHRVFYVAATRAKKTLTWVEGGKLSY